MPGREAIKVTKEEFQTAVETLEKTQPEGKFKNRSALWHAMEESVWAKTRQPVPLSAQVAMSRAKVFGTKINTPLGKKGKEKGQGPTNVVSRKRKPMADNIVTALMNGIPIAEDGKKIREKYNGTVAKAAKGSLKAVIKLKCLDCCAWQQKEVSLCTVIDCPNWNYRPYKNKVTLTEDGRKRINLGLLEDDTDEQEQESD